MGVSGSGDQIAIADRDWIGPYKRGGRRAGPLYVVTIKTGRARAVTDKLVSVAGEDWRNPSRKPEEIEKRWRKDQEESIQYETFRYLFKTWDKKWPRARHWHLSFLGANTESNPVLTRLLKRLRAEKYPVGIGPYDDSSETLMLALHDLRWAGKKSVLIHAAVSHSPLNDPDRASRRSPIGDHYYGDVILACRSGRWQVLGIKGRWEQPE